jgi:hypothetical protein
MAVVDDLLLYVMRSVCVGEVFSLAKSSPCLLKFCLDVAIELRL